MQQRLVFRRVYEIKENESISWNYEQPWLQQFEAQLNSYIQHDRHKSEAHQNYAAQLKRVIDLIKLKPEQEQTQAILDDLFPLLQERSNHISEKGGWNRKPSYLFALCKLGDEYFSHQLLLAEATRKHVEALKQQQEDIIAKKNREVEEFKLEQNYYLLLKDEEIARKDAKIQLLTETLEDTLKKQLPENNAEQIQIKNLKRDLTQEKENNELLGKANARLQNENNGLKRQEAASLKELEKLTQTTQLLQSAQANNRALTQQVHQLQQAAKAQPITPPSPIQSPQKQGDQKVATIADGPTVQDNVNELKGEMEKIRTAARQVYAENQTLKQKLTAVEKLLTPLINLYKWIFGEPAFDEFEQAEVPTIPRLTDHHYLLMKRIAVVPPDVMKQKATASAINQEVEDFEKGKSTNGDRALLEFGSKANDAIGFISAAGGQFLSWLDSPIIASQPTTPQKSTTLQNPNTLTPNHKS